MFGIITIATGVAEDGGQVAHEKPGRARQITLQMLVRILLPIRLLCELCGLIIRTKMNRIYTNQAVLVTKMLKMKQLLFVSLCSPCPCKP